MSITPSYELKTIRPHKLIKDAVLSPPAKLINVAPESTQSSMAVSPTSIVALPVIENPFGEESEGGYYDVGYYILGAPTEVEVPDNLNACRVEETTLPEEKYLSQILSCPKVIDTASDGDQILAGLIRPLQRVHP